MNRFVLLFALLTLPAVPTLAQEAPTTPATSPAEKSVGRAYLLVGGALPQFSPLNTALRGTAYPALGPGAVVIGVGYGTARPGRLNLGMETRAVLRGHRDGPARPRTFLATVALAVPLRYDVVRRPRFGLEVLAGPQVQLLDLALRGTDSTATFGSYVSTGQAGAARRLTQAIYGLMGGLEATWRLPRVWADAKDGSTSQLTVGLRVQATLPVAWARWRTQRTGTGRNSAQTTGADQPLTGGPRLNPERLSVALVVGGLFGLGTGAK